MGLPQLLNTFNQSVFINSLSAPPTQPGNYNGEVCFVYGYYSTTVIYVSIYFWSSSQNKWLPIIGFPLNTTSQNPIPQLAYGGIGSRPPDPFYPNITSGTAQVLSTNTDVLLHTSIQLSPTSTAAASVTMSLMNDLTGTVTTPYTVAQSPAGGPSITVPYTCFIPSNWKITLTLTNASLVSVGTTGGNAVGVYL
jgi:hypothetical protein